MEEAHYSDFEPSSPITPSTVGIYESKELMRINKRYLSACINDTHYSIGDVDKKYTDVVGTVVFHRNYEVFLDAVNEAGDLGIILILDDHWHNIEGEFLLAISHEAKVQLQDRQLFNPCKLKRFKHDRKLLAVLTAIPQPEPTVLIWKQMTFYIMKDGTVGF